MSDKAYQEEVAGVKWKKALYRWAGVTNPNRLWWQFWKPRKANIILTFHYHYTAGEMHLGEINLEIVHE